MHSLPPSNSLLIVLQKKNLPAAKCRKCGAKMFPKSLLKPHLNRHQRRERWLRAEVNKLQHRFGRLRKIG